MLVLRLVRSCLSMDHEQMLSAIFKHSSLTHSSICSKDLENGTACATLEEERILHEIV